MVLFDFLIENGVVCVCGVEELIVWSESVDEVWGNMDYGVVVSGLLGVLEIIKVMGLRRWDLRSEW